MFAQGNLRKCWKWRAFFDECPMVTGNAHSKARLRAALMKSALMLSFRGDGFGFFSRLGRVVFMAHHFCSRPEERWEVIVDHAQSAHVRRSDAHVCLRG